MIKRLANKTSRCFLNMSRHHSHINTAIQMLRLYKGEIPFSIFLKHFFAKEKKYGSKDRKQIASLCYSYFRIGLALNKNITEENIITAFFLTSKDPSALVQELKPGWANAITKSVQEKIIIAKAGFSVRDIFPFTNELNDDTNAELFSKSFLEQPYLFIRTRPQYKNTVVDKIKKSKSEYQFLKNNNCVQFPPATKIGNFLTPDKEVVIQDYNSQQVLNYIISSNFFPDKKEVTVWDCCAASGGKSILIFDLLQGKIKLTVSDIRQSIITNLQQRFKKAGIKNYHHFVADISSEVPAAKYDIIICDAPCTGSGTWSRTPEQLYFFNPEAIDEFASRQKRITVNILSHLNHNGLFFYITCSVFKKENEDVVAHISKQPGIQLIEMKNLDGSEINADSMFVAVFTKTN